MACKVTGVTRTRISVGGREAVLVELQTDAGIRGYGEVAVDGYPETMLGFLRDAESTLIGWDAFRVEQFSHRVLPLHVRTSAPILRGMAALETALWDIKGRALQSTVAQFFGGAVRDRIRVCVRDVPAGSPDEFARAAASLLAQGITALRWRPLLDRTRILRRGYLEVLLHQVERIRQAVGPEVDLVCDLASVPSPALARAIGRALEPLRPCLLADPCTPADPQTLARLTGDIRVPTCGGSGGRRPDQLPLLHARALSALCLDPAGCGGLSEARYIAGAAEVHSTPVVVTYGGVWASPGPAWQLATVVPNVLFLEVPYNENLWRTGLPHPLRIEKGYLNIPEAPGLGTDPDLAALQRAGGSVAVC